MALVEQMEKVAREQKAAAVPKVTVTVGALSGVDPEALKGAFPLAAEESVAAGAELVIEWIKASVQCRACGKISQPEAPFIYCEGCKSSDVEVKSGRELYITSIEVDVAE
jgi:hydrogenase nickel incorporation protein HypA/HybF